MVDEKIRSRREARHERREAARERREAGDYCCSRDDERMGALLAGLILITIGGLFLASNLGYLPWSIGEMIYKLWPIIPGLIGIWLIAKYFMMR
jgi:hypothetical protein